MISQQINTKPLSVNQCWQGKRFKTDKYKAYEKIIGYQLKNGALQVGKIELFFRFGFSSKSADNDNPVKPLQDILSKYYGFNDNRVYRTVIEKVDVPKGKEFLYFEIKKFE